MRNLLFERLFGSCCVRLGVSRRLTRRTEVTHDLMDGGFIRLDGRDGGSSSIMCSYILGLYMNPSGYMLVRTARSELIVSGRDSERTGIGVNGSRRAPTI